MAACGAAPAQDGGYPARAIRAVVPFVPGGGTDNQARLLGKKFQEFTGQTLVIDNRPGAGGLIGAELVTKAPPDGYTLLLTTTSIAINVSLHRKIAFDPFKDLAPVTLLSTGPYLLAVHPSMPVKSTKELVALAKRSPTRMNSASSGAGTAPHITLEMFNRTAGINAQHIPYKGGGAAVLALITGEVEFNFLSAFTAGPYVKSGRIRALAITSREPVENFPGLPTVGATYPGFESYNWYALFLPAATPRDIVMRVHGLAVKSLHSPELQAYIKMESGTASGSTPEEFAAYYRSEVERYAQVIKAAKIQAN